MQRRTFLATAACALTASTALRAIAAPSLDFTFPGNLGAFAQYLNQSLPFVEYHDKAIFSSASVIKLLIAVGTMRRVEAEGLPLTMPLTIAASNIVDGSDTFGKSPAGSRASIHNLMVAMITQSDNTAANVLLDWVGMRRLDALAASCGMWATSFGRHFMDFGAKTAGHDNVTSARDMATLARGIALGVSGGFVDVTPAGCRFIYIQMRAQEDRETIPAAIARGVSVANKTGELEHVRHDVAIVGLGTQNAYAIALLSEYSVSRAEAMQRLRHIAAEIDEAAAAFATTAPSAT
jgi:beta-lactamase class A